MTREEKNKVIDELTGVLNDAEMLYLADISGLDAEKTSALRRMCFNREVKLSVVKNTLLQKAMERSDKKYDDLYPVLEGNTSIMISDTANVPAKLIKEMRKKSDKPILKAALIEDAIYIGDEHMKPLSELKSKAELIGDVITLLQSPAQNVISALKSGGGQKIGGLLKTLEEKGDQ